MIYMRRRIVWDHWRGRGWFYYPLTPATAGPFVYMSKSALHLHATDFDMAWHGMPQSVSQSACRQVESKPLWLKSLQSP